MVYRITFINPKVHDGIQYSYKSRMAPYRLAVLAGQVPENWEPKIVDESVESLTYEDTDLAAITVSTPTATRAYEIADGFAEKGVQNLLGGVHPTVRSFEASMHGTVVAGESEVILPKVLKDYEKGILQTYYNGGHVAMNKAKPPRFDLLTHRYVIYPIQFSRGCPHDCEPCSVSSINGHEHRSKDYQRFIDEINSCGSKFILVADDNFIGSTKQERENVKTLLRKMKNETDVKLAGQVTVNFAKDRELMKLAADTGFCEFLIGFEDRDPYSLREIGKAVNCKTEYKKDVIEPMHDNGFSITGSFLLGLDNHDKKVFSRYVDFVKDADIDTSVFAIVTPFPSTRFEKRLREEGRIFRDNYPEDWKYYDINHAVFHPKQMTAGELETGTLEALSQVTNPLENYVRAFKSLINTRNIYGSGASFWLNNTTGIRVRNRLREKNHNN